VDPAQLEQVIVNLAVNARDAMPNGGELVISARRERITAAVAGGRTELPVGTDVVRLDVRDDGHGMDEAVRARIFEPFFTTKRASGGTGLGLAMAYGIVKQSGGTIHVDSSPGQGTTFELRFPPAWGERPEEDAEDVPPPPKGTVTGTILVVEDDPAVRRVADRTLRREGWNVRVAADAEQGLELLEEEGARISVVLTDLVLPGMNGRDLIDRVRARYPRVRCIAMSGYAEGSPERRVDLPPEVVFLPKPFTIEGLQRALDAAADLGPLHPRRPPEPM
jgi:CheY-like chemotaxis protein